MVKPDDNASSRQRKIAEGDDLAQDDLFNLVYQELGNVARQHLRKEYRPDHSWSTTDLVHEVFLRLVEEFDQRSTEQEFLTNRRRFYFVVHRAMHQRLIEHARRRKAAKRGGDMNRVPFDDVLDQLESAHGCSFSELEAALEELAASHPEVATMVQMRFLTGMTSEQISKTFECSERHVQKKVTFGRAKIEEYLSQGVAHDGSI